MFYKIRDLNKLEDKTKLKDFYENVSEHSKKLRFHSPKPFLNEKLWDYFMNVDDYNHLASVATVNEKIVGVVRIVRIDDETAEIAFLVADEWHGKGIASSLIKHIFVRALKANIKFVYAELKTDNHGARALLHKISDSYGKITTQFFSYGESRVIINLEPASVLKHV